MENSTENIPEKKALIQVQGILDIHPNGMGQLLNLQKNGHQSPTDPFIPKDMISKFKLSRGQHISGKSFQNEQYRNPKICYIDTIDGILLNDRRQIPNFTSLTTITPLEQLKLETKDQRMTNRVIDLFCPIGKGQRGLIVAPPRSGKTMLLHDLAKGIKENHPECHLMVLLVDERPEEVTDFNRTVEAEIFASSNDEPIHNHIRIADIAIDRAKKLVEIGKDVVLLMDSITRLSRAHNTLRGSGKTLTGGLDARALERPRQIFASARKTEEAGSLTIIASALVETGSKMDELIFQEFKGTGNLEIVLDRKIAELRLWPAINLTASGTRKEELMIPPQILAKIHFLRRAFINLKPEEAIEALLSRLSKTHSNAEFLSLINPASYPIHAEERR
jgi:transcription termination factor Rho